MDKKYFWTFCAQNWTTHYYTTITIINFTISWDYPRLYQVSRKSRKENPLHIAVLWSRDHGLETQVHSSSFCQGLGLETWRPMSRSWSQDSMLGAYACSTITVFFCTFKQVLWHHLELMQPVLWSRDHGLETQVHFVQVSVSRPEVQGLGLGLKRPEDPCLGLGLETWWPRSRSWSRDLKSKVSRPKKVLTTTLAYCWYKFRM